MQSWLLGKLYSAHEVIDGRWCDLHFRSSITKNNVIKLSIMEDNHWRLSPSVRSIQKGSFDLVKSIINKDEYQLSGTIPLKAKHYESALCTRPLSIAIPFHINQNDNLESALKWMSMKCEKKKVNKVLVSMFVSPQSWRLKTIAACGVIRLIIGK